jgi:O-antigen biosynthesis protein WbqV
VGAGDQADSFIREMVRSALATYRVVGIVDDKPGRIGRDIRGVRILGSLDNIDDVVARLDRDAMRPQRLIIAGGSYGGEQVQGLLQCCERLGMTLARLPRLTDFDSSKDIDPDAGHGTVQAFEPRPVDVEDLLGRPQKVLDRDAMRNLITGRRVLVTGAGGTIGSELVRQVADFEPSRLTLLDNAEYNLYRIDLEIGERHPQLSRRSALADVRDPERLADILTTETPDLLFHAAAFKHVPLVEENSEEGVLTNVIGTSNVAEACQRAGVGTMVLISTDKAVAPSSVMGATKRIAERYCQALGAQTAGNSATTTRFLTVRFGNVLGSTGSVVPLFTRQIASGGPVTVTHEAVTRYFMTTSEAVELVLQACTLQDDDTDARGKIYVLDMGEPVRILDLAHQLIRLAGLRPEKDIAVSFTGLRAGEKLHEQLFDTDEQVTATAHQSIRIASSPAMEVGFVRSQTEKLKDAARARRTDDMLKLISALIPGYRSQGTQAEGPEERAVANSD